MSTPIYQSVDISLIITRDNYRLVANLGTLEVTSFRDFAFQPYIVPYRTIKNFLELTLIISLISIDPVGNPVVSIGPDERIR